MIIAYANPIEVKYITAPVLKVCIKTKARDVFSINRCMIFIGTQKVVLFGTCGDLGHHRTDVFYTRTDNMLTLSSSLHDKYQRIYYAECGYETVDQETEIVLDYCRERHIELKVYRYIIDRCDRKVMPVGLNHFWRKWQHWRMQRKFNRMLKEGNNGLQKV